MNDKKKSKSAVPKTKRIATTNEADDSGKKPAAKTRKASAKSAPAVVKTRKTKAETVAAPASKRASKTGRPIAKTKKTAAKGRTRKVPAGAGIEIGEPVVDPIGDVSSGEAPTYLGDAEPSANAELEAFRADTAEDALEATLEAAPEVAAAANEAHGVKAGYDSDAMEAAAEPRPPANLERLQKILSQAGIASRRHAEEMIVAGRVIVNGQVVTTLGSKADPAHDHIRVDGKLLHGAERHRYFVLNKPKGYVTTVSDPEGRPTVMEFFAQMRERLYPVGRLDYQSEGLLLVTNDGELANLLSKAGSGVEKTYLVKVAGQPSEEDLERLRGGVAIEREEAGSERVRTAPARIRPVREGNNPWYEVVLIEGRNRELRKMFSAVGHFVEKIRRVGYGPLVLDVEPGNLRELTPEEVKALRLTAEGKLKPKRMKVDRVPPAEAGRAPEKRAERRGVRDSQETGRRPNPRFDRPPGQPGSGDPRLEKPGASSEKPRWKKDERGPKREFRPRSPEFGGPPQSRPEFRGPKPFGREVSRSEGSNRGHFKPRSEQRFGSAPRAPFKPRSDRPEFRPAPRQERGERPFGSAPRPPFKPRSDRPEFRPAPRQERGERPFGSSPRPPFKPRGDRPEFRPAPRQERGENRFGSSPRPPFNPRSERPQFRPAPRQERGENRFGSAPRAAFKPRSERPEFRPAPRQEHGEAKPRLEVERITGVPKDASFGGGKPKPSFGRKPGFSGKPGSSGKPGGFGKFRGNTRGGPKRGFSRPGAQRGGGKRG